MRRSFSIPLDWQHTHLSDVCVKITDGTHDTPTPTKFGVPYITAIHVKDAEIAFGNCYYLSSEDHAVIYRRCNPQCDDVLIVNIGAGTATPARVKVDFEFSMKNVALLKPDKSKLSGHYLEQYQLHNKPRLFHRLTSGGAQPFLSLKQLGKLPIILPPLPEQKAIADLLSTWDEAIEKTERLIHAKEANLKGQIQRIMGKEAIDANGWSIVHLGDLFSEVTRKVGQKELTPYSISAGIGFVSQREKWGKDISGSQHKNYIHLNAGEFSYNKGNSKRYQQGCVYLLKDGEICVPNVFISFKPKAKNVVPEFFEHYFIADYHARELKRYITSGARSDGLLNLNKKDFFKIMVPCPSPEEQKAIAEALSASQQEIDLLKQLADKYKTQKRGLMQKMLTGEWRVKDEVVKSYE
ncbi:MAG: restriction endonuclease subunit S [Spartobacteria bacterium]|nr:restriction endonuclease subunit S [Spartobacteria bacterium]